MRRKRGKMIELDCKVYEVREYKKFPVKKYFADNLVRTFKKQDEAFFESMFLNRKNDTKRYYVIDNPHVEIELTDKERLELKTKYGLL